jgi:hypothetical protein
MTGVAAQTVEPPMNFPEMCPLFRAETILDRCECGEKIEGVWLAEELAQCVAVGVLRFTDAFPG